MSGTISVYLDVEDFDKTTLLQGDIVKNIHLLGAINLNAIQYTSSQNDPEISSWMVPSKPIFGDAMVISHSCEIAKENGVKVTSILLAPLRDINSATHPSKVTELIESNIIDKDNLSPSYLKYFYIPNNPSLLFSEGAVVDFSKSFSLRKQSYDYLLENKVAQITDESQSSMSFKLALYYYRENRTQDT